MTRIGKSLSALIGSTALIVALSAIPAAGTDQPFALSDTCSISGLPQPLPSCVVTFNIPIGGKQYVLETTTVQASLGIGQVVMDLWLTGYLGGFPFTHFIPVSRADTVNSGFSYNVYAGALTGRITVDGGTTLTVGLRTTDSLGTLKVGVSGIVR